MKDFALKFWERLGLGAEEFENLSEVPLAEPLVLALPIVFFVSLAICLLVVFSKVGRGEDEEEGEGISELDKEIALIKSLQRR